MAPKTTDTKKNETIRQSVAGHGTGVALRRTKTKTKSPVTFSVASQSVMITIRRAYCSTTDCDSSHSCPIVRPFAQFRSHSAVRATGPSGGGSGGKGVIRLPPALAGQFGWRGRAGCGLDTRKVPSRLTSGTASIGWRTGRDCGAKLL